MPQLFLIVSYLFIGFILMIGLRTIGFPIETYGEKNHDASTSAKEGVVKGIHHTSRICRECWAGGRPITLRTLVLFTALWPFCMAGVTICIFVVGISYLNAKFSEVII